MRCATASATQHAPMSVHDRLVGQRRQIIALVLVLNLDHLSFLETLKAHETLTTFSIPVAGLVVNRVLPDEGDGSFISAKRRQETQHLDDIDRLFAHLPRVRVPLHPDDVHDMNTLRRVG